MVHSQSQPNQARYRASRQPMSGAKPSSFDILPPTAASVRPCQRSPQLPRLCPAVRPPVNPGSDQGPALPDQLLPDQPAFQPSPYPSQSPRSTSASALSTAIPASPTVDAVSSPFNAMNILRRIEARIIGWQSQLQQVMAQMEALYHEGPIIDGWIQKTPSMSDNPATEPITHYYLCGQDRQGELWHRYCPPEQVATVSLAIARYGKLRELIAQKQQIESRLSQIAQIMVHFYQQINQVV